MISARNDQRFWTLKNATKLRVGADVLKSLEMLGMPCYKFVVTGKLTEAADFLACRRLFQNRVRFDQSNERGCDRNPILTFDADPEVHIQTDVALRPVMLDALGESKS